MADENNSMASYASNMTLEDPEDMLSDVYSISDDSDDTEEGDDYEDGDEEYVERSSGPDGGADDDDEDDDEDDDQPLDVDRLMNLAEAEFHFDPDRSQLHPVVRSRLRPAIVKRTQADLHDITKLCHYEYLKNPLSTQFILNGEVARSFKKYSEHGSQARLEKGIMQFLQAGDTVVRPITERTKGRYHKPGPAELKLIEVESRLPRYEKARMRFATIPTSDAKGDSAFTTADQDRTSDVQSGIHATDSETAAATGLNDFTAGTPQVSHSGLSYSDAKRVENTTQSANVCERTPGLSFGEPGHEGYVPGISTQEVNMSGHRQPYLRRVLAQNAMGRLLEANVAADNEYYFDDTEDSVAKYGPKVGRTMRSPPRPQETFELAYDAQHARRVDGIADAVRIPSIQELLPVQEMLNHAHPSTLTTDPENHKRLDPSNPQPVPFNPVHMRFALRNGLLLPPSASTILNNICELENLSAREILAHLTIKYTPRATIAHPHPPAPPYALFRTAIAVYYDSQFSSILTSAQDDPLGLSPQVRALLKDLYEDPHFSYGRAGETALDTYHNMPNSIRHDNWRLGHEAVVSNGLNDVESEVLSRATRVLDEACDMWWEDRTADQHQWLMLRVWCRVREVERLKNARRNGWF